MRRVATAVVLLARARARWRQASPSSSSSGETGDAPARATKGSATKLTVWVGWSARELAEFKKVVAEYDRKNPNVDGQGRRRASTTTRSSPRSAAATRPTSSARSPRTTSASTARRAAGSTSAPYLEEGRRRASSIFPAATQYYTQYKGNALRAAAARRRLRPLLQQDALQATAGITSPPKTISELTAVREEADEAERGRLAQGRRLRPVLRLLREHGRAPISRSWAASGSTRRGKSIARAPTRLVEVAAPGRRAWSTGTATTKLVRCQAGAGDEFSASHAFETRQARDEPRRRVARRVHRGRASRAGVRHGADAGRRRPAGALRLGLHQRHDHRHPEERRSTRTRPGRSSST